MSTYLKNIILTLNRQFFSLLIGTLISVLIARYLGIEERGIYALIILLPTTIFTFTNLGMNSSVVYYIGQKKYTIEEMIQSLKLLTIFTIFFSTCIGILGIVFFQDLFFKDIEDHYLFISLFLLPALIYNSFFQAIFVGHENFKKFNLILFLQPMIFLVFLLINLLFDYQVLGVLIAELLANYIISLVTYIYIKREYGAYSTKAVNSLMYLKFKYGLKSHLTNVLAFFNYRLDIFMVTYYLDLLSVGAYVIAVNIAEKLWMLSSAVSAVMFARIANMINEKEKSYLTIASAKVVFLVSFLIGIFLYLVGGKLIVLLFGLEYSNSVLPFVYLLPGIVMGAVTRVYSNYIAAQGKPEYNLYVALFLLFENLILNIILIPQYGLMGAAISTSIAYITNFLFKIVIFKWMSQLSFREIIFLTKDETNLLRIYKKKILHFLKNKGKI